MFMGLRTSRHPHPMAALFACGLGIVVGTSAWGQVVLPPQSDISRQRVAPLPLPTPSYDFRIQSPEKTAVPRAVDEIEFSITAVRVTGATYFPQADVDALFSPLVGRKIVLQDLRVAAQKLEDRYRAAGFFLTRVFVPPQKVKDGVLEVQVLEGYIGDVFVDGPNPASTRLVESLMTDVPKERPAKFSQLERRMLVINDIPGLSGNTVLQPGGVLGSSEMLVSASKTQNQYRANFSNTSSQIIGPLAYSLGGTISQPFQKPGALDVTLAAAGQGLRELRSGNMRYAFPIGAHGFIGSLGGLIAFARPGGAVADLDIRSRVMSINGRLRAPLMRSRKNSVYVDLGIALNRNKTNVLGTPLSDDRSTVAEATLLWQQAGLFHGDTNISLSLFQGLPIIGANSETAPLPSVAGFQPKFHKLVYVLQRNQRLAPRVNAQLNVQGQYTTDRLSSGETISYGGAAIGRGYDPSVIGGDRGIGLSGELRYAVPYAAEGVAEGAQLYSFADYARATTLATDLIAAQTNNISSLGLGVRMTMLRRFNVDVQGAQARRQLVTGDTVSTRLNLNILMVF